jgi:hypothetical protein
MKKSKPLRLVCWNADGVLGRKHELQHLFNQLGIDICLFSETFLNPRQAFRLASYICHRTDRLTAGGGTAILVRRGIVHHSVSVPCLTLLEATANQVILACRQKNSCGLTLPMPSVDLSGPDRLFQRGIAGDFNAKQVDWNSRMSTRRGKFLRGYGDENSCLIFGTDTPTTNPYNPSATGDVTVTEGFP